MNIDLGKMAYQWISSTPDSVDVSSKYYCKTRDVFDARFNKMFRELINKDDFAGDPYVVSVVAGEIGNNSFDHNIGNWPDIPGIFFGYAFFDNSILIVTADRGQGILKTLGKVKPELSNDKEALVTAFTERISGRAPESRGNGLKFVRESVEKKKMHLTFLSGRARAELNEKMSIEETTENIKGCLAIIKL